jgi:O-antigen/teichoic acid export membrane protein
MAARVVDAAFAVVYLRLLGRADVGAYQFLVIFTTYLDTLIDFGLNALVAREVSVGRVAASAAFRAVNLLRLGLWCAGLPVVAIVYGPLRETSNLSPEAALAGWAFYVALLPTVLAKTATGLLWAAERLELTAGVSVLATLFRTAVGGLALFGGYGLVGLAATSALTNVLTALALWRLAARTPAIAAQAARAPAAGAVGAAETRPLAWLRESWPLFLNQLLQGLFFKVDGALMLPLAGAVAGGTYAAAYKVSEGAGIVSSAFTLALFPRLSRSSDPETNAAQATATTAAEALAEAYRLPLRLLLQIAFPLAAGIALLSEPIVSVVAGRDYLPDSAIALSILICYLPLSYANGLTQYVLIAAGRQRLLTGAFVAALVFNVAANLLLIPRFGYIGAAWVTVASELVLLVPFARAAARVAPGVSLLREARIPVFATLLMAPVVWWLRDAIHPAAAIAAGAIIYPLALWALGGIDAQQMRLLRQLFPREILTRSRTGNGGR